MKTSTSALSLLPLLLACVGSLAQPTDDPVDCNISDPAALSRCLRLLLLDRRQDVVREAEPLRLRDGLLNARNLEVSNFRLGGLSCYEVDDLRVTFPREMSISIDARLSWTDLVALADVRYRLPIIGWIGARPILTVRRASGRLQTTLNVAINSAGRLSVTPSDTAVTVDLHDIDIPSVRLRGDVVNFLNFIVGSPARSQAKKAVIRQWRENRDGLQRDAAEELDKLIVDSLAVHLKELLRVDGSSSSGGAAGASGGSSNTARVGSGQCHRSITYGSHRSHRSHRRAYRG